MKRWFTFILLSAFVLPALGCGLTGESTLDAMKRRAKALADANKEKEERDKQKAAKAGQTPAKATSQSDADDESPPDDNTTNAVDSASKTAAASKAATAEPRAVTKGDAPSSASADPAAIRPPIPVKPEMPLTDIQRRNKSAENLDQIVKALNKHAREKGTYPTQAITSKRLGHPLLSWRVAILPELGLGEFYKEFKLDEPWDSPHNAALLPHIPSVFISPERCDEKTNYLAPHGPGAAWHGIRGTDPLSYADGADTTLIVLEADESAAVPWTKPEDLPTDGKMRSRLGSLRGDGFLATFGSGYVAMIHNKITDGQLSWMLSTDGEDYLTDRAIIFDATVPDVALVAKEPKPDAEDPGDAATRESKKPGEKGTDVAAGSAAKPPDRIRGLPPVKLPPPPKKPERLAVPEEEELAEAREKLRELYQPEYRQSRTRGDRQKMAIKMLAEASRVEEEAAAHYEILRMARDIAVHVGDHATALKAVELVETKFQIPPLVLRLKTLEELAGASGQGATQLAAEAEKVLISAYESDDYPQALAAHRLLIGLLRRGGDGAKLARYASHQAAILEAEKAYNLVPAALSALATNAENTEANDVAGKYFCLIKEQWEIGLPMMARGQDLKLRILARMDLEESKTGEQHVQLTDQYWELALDYRQPQRRALELRAAYYYAAARPLLSGGIDLVKAEKRIEEAGRTYGKAALAKAAGTTGVLPTLLADPKDDSG